MKFLSFVVQSLISFVVPFLAFAHEGEVHPEDVEKNARTADPILLLAVLVSFWVGVFLLWKFLAARKKKQQEPKEHV